MSDFGGGLLIITVRTSRSSVEKGSTSPKSCWSCSRGICGRGTACGSNGCCVGHVVSRGRHLIAMRLCRSTLAPDQFRPALVNQHGDPGLFTTVRL